MRRLPPLALVLFILLVPCVRAGVQPRLTHSAPFLGHELTLRIEGAPALQTVRLFASPRAGARVLPFGVFELDGDQASLVVQGATDAAGVFSAQLTLPVDPARAEEELHYQALIDDPTGPAGALLSSAVHARLLGPRAYVGSRGYEFQGTTYLAGVTIVSAVHDAVVATVDFGAPRPEGEAQGDAEPVFSSNFARGAVMASPFELVFFDPFFGELQQTLSFEEASRTLLVDRDTDRLFVLETGLEGAHARVHVLDFASGDTLDVVDLPRRASGLWLAGPDDLAYIAEFDGGRTSVRRFGLDDLAGHGSIAVGGERSHLFVDMTFAAGQLFLGTETRYYPTGYVRADFSRVDYRVQPATVDVTSSPFQRQLANLTPVPGAGLLLWGIFMSGGPDAGMGAARLDSPGAPVRVRPAYPASGVRDMAARDAGAWVMVFSRDQDVAERLYFLDQITPSSWTVVSHLPCYSGAVDMEALRDAFVDKVIFSVTCGTYGNEQEPFLVLHDVASGAQTHLPGGQMPESLRVVTVP